MDDTTRTTIEQASTALGEPLTVIGAPLPTSDRNQVIRAQARGRTVIVKRNLTQDPFASGRESSALLALNSIDPGCAPRVLAEGDGLLVLEDLGDGGNVADALTGEDAAAAEAAVRAWAAGLGRFHVAGRAAASLFEDEMMRRTGTSSAYMDAQLEEAAAAWVGLAADLGVHTERSTFDDLASLTTRFRTDLSTLSAGDMCPDNNLLVDGRVVMIDLEFATIRHLAWDVAYLQVPWPSCWCAWTLPDGLTRAALAAWQASAASLLGDIAADDLRHDLRLAADGWRWLSSYWLLEQLAGPPRPARPERPSPRHQDRIVHSLRAAATSPLLPSLREVAADLAAAVEQRFNAQPLGYPRALAK
ncbi:phosphotransferase [Calidifontibacter sp. DB0510]|uniref:Phosphotransferase n=1 Tax=Metallococcus carri TaxID=1656884 RepID=A0A967EEF6_9MICO|nr:phosphotransferase [Metallococcus carri]NHN55621.1 phosphotransferase [Metallococcus carri]NOP38195.1 phosphotransferase [Calidifontibacter sp. DB2511S]